MINKIVSIYPVDSQRHDHQRSKDGSKKKQEIQFKDVLEKTITNSIGKK